MYRQTGLANKGTPDDYRQRKVSGNYKLTRGGECDYARDGAIVFWKTEHIQLFKLINATLLAAYGHKQFCWSSVQVNKNTVSTPHKDVANVGPSAITILGEFTGGELYIDDEVVF